MNFNRHEKEELLLFFKKYFGDENEILDSNTIEVQKNIAKRYTTFNSNNFLFFEILFPDNFKSSHILYNKEGVLIQKKYSFCFKNNDTPYSLRLVYSKHSFFEKEYMNKFDFQNCEDLDNLFDFILLPKKMILSDEAKNFKFEIELKFFIDTEEIFGSFNNLAILKKDKALTHNLHTQLINHYQQMFQKNTTSLGKFDFKTFDKSFLCDIFNLPKGLYIFKDFEVVVRTKPKRFFFRSDNVSIYLNYNLKYYHFTTATGVKKTLKWYFLAPY